MYFLLERHFFFTLIALFVVCEARRHCSFDSAKTTLECTIKEDEELAGEVVDQDEWIQEIEQVNRSSVTIFRLSENGLVSLPEGIFDNMTSLEELYLERNSLWKIPEEAFRDLTSLLVLNISGNSLTSQFLSAETFGPGLRSLVALDLSHNQLEHLDSGLFTPLPSLQLLYLDHNSVRNVSDAAFAGLGNLKFLSLAQNYLRTLDRSTFVPLRSLKALQMEENRIEDINGLLATLEHLVWFNVSSNRLQWFDYAFIPRSVEWLDLHANLIESLGNYYGLNEGYKLKIVDARQNLIGELNPESFPDSLEYAYLTHNSISRIRPSTFASKSRLQRVELGFNQLRSLEASALSVLDKNSEVPAEFKISANPFLCDCRMDWLHSDVVNVLDLEDIVCELEDKDPGERFKPFVDTRVDEFVCSYKSHCFALCLCCDFLACDCRMECPEGCDCYHDRTWNANLIRCSGRNHTRVPDNVPMDATSLRLDGNRLEALGRQPFIGKKRLTSLFLNDSRVVAIDGQTFNGLSRLEVLHLEGNEIGELRGNEFDNLTSLRELYLNDNRLIYVSTATFVVLVRLEVLRLDGNMLSLFPIWEISNPSLRALYISGNPWSCECGFVGRSRNFVSSNVDLVRDAGELQCVMDNEIAEEGDGSCVDHIAASFRTQKAGDLLVTPIIACVMIACVIVATATLFAFVFRNSVSLWLHSRYGFRIQKCGGDASAEEEDGRVYEAYLSYCMKDSAFVSQSIVPSLEGFVDDVLGRTSPKHRLCLHYRDLPLDSSVEESFRRGSESSRKTVVLVSRCFLGTEWYQIRTQLQHVPKRRLLFVLLEELCERDVSLVPELALYLRTCRVLRCDEKHFFRKLRFHLPDPPRGRRALDCSSNSTYSGESDYYRRDDDAKTRNAPISARLDRGSGQVRSVYRDEGWNYTLSNASVATGLTLLAANNSNASCSSTSSEEVEVYLGSAAAVGGAYERVSPSSTAVEHVYMTVNDCLRPSPHIYHTITPEVGAAHSRTLSADSYPTRKSRNIHSLLHHHPHHVRQASLSVEESVHQKQISLPSTCL